MAVRIRCNGCGYILATKLPLADTILTCPSCKESFSIRKGSEHVASFKIKRQPQPFQCKWCGDDFGSPHGLRAHYIRRHSDQYHADKDEQEQLRSQFIEANRENQRWQQGQVDQWLREQSEKK